MAKYGIREEQADNTLGAPFAEYTNKAKAIAAAKSAAKYTCDKNLVRIWVDNMLDGSGVVSFEVAQ